MKAKKRSAFDPMVFLSKAGDEKAIADYKEKKSIFRQGEPATTVYYLQKGKVKLTVISKQGKEAVIAILGKGDFFGEGCLAGQPMRMSTATAMTDCSVMRLQKASMVRVLQSESAFS